MRSLHVDTPFPSRFGRRALAPVDRWVLAPVIAGAVFAAIQTVHLFEMLYYWPTGVILESVLPLLLAVVVAFVGPWLSWRGYARAERRRVTLWMALVAVLLAGVFAWALSHQFVMGQSFPHAGFVTGTTLIAGSLLGVLVGLYDVEARRRQLAVEQQHETLLQQRSRLSVLNRVLRHNIRNDANVILGTTAEIVDRSTGDVADLASVASGKADELVDRSEKARRIEEMLAIEEDDLVDVDIAATFEAVTARYADREDVRFRVEVPADLPSIVTDEEVVVAMLGELVENAVDHADTDTDSDTDTDTDTDPLEVRLSANVDDAGSIELVVADDGAGLPAQERQTLQADVETALVHSSGLGLWFVKWGVLMIGGDVTFADGDRPGTEIRISLPRDASRSARRHQVASLPL